MHFEKILSELGDLLTCGSRKSFSWYNSKYPGGILPIICNVIEKQKQLERITSLFIVLIHCIVSQTLQKLNMSQVFFVIRTLRECWKGQSKLLFTTSKPNLWSTSLIYEGLNNILLYVSLSKFLSRTLISTFCKHRIAHQYFREYYSLRPI